MVRYSVFLREEAHATAPKSGVQRSMVMEFIRSLADDPFQSGDFHEHDSVGRRLEVKIVGRYAVTFWSDHPVKEVKVVHIRLADR